uniref:RNA-directed RNA polymerase n=1 Tax=Panagrolaimus superbus TaxID=310955 RepID=A0A914Y1G9_9BILA
MDSDKAKKISVNELQEEHAKFRSDYLKNRNIEHLSNCYLALSLTQDIDSLECRSMRQMSDKAVNYPKSGICCRAVSADERQYVWPSFMCKDHEPAYKTSHILCQIYDKDSALYQMIKNVAEEAKKRRNDNSTTDQGEDRMTWVQKYFEEYKKQIQAIMIKQRIKTEGELFSNAFTGTFGALGKQKLPLLNDSAETSMIQHQIHQIFKSFRADLLNMFSSDWKEDMENKRKNIFSYQLPNVSPRMIRLAKHFYEISAEDKTCFSFPWLIWEGLDAWWSSDPYKCQNDSVEGNLDKDFHKIHGSTILKTKIVRNVATNFRWENRFRVRRTPSETFEDMIKAWAVCENIDRNIFMAEAGTYLQNYLILNNTENHTVTGSKIFTSFLTSKMQNKNAAENGCGQLQKAAQNTLIKLGFLPELNIFKENLFRRQLMEQQCIVINVPKNLVRKFERSYQILKGKSGCQDVAIGIRRTFPESVKFSVMFRGTIESCQNLKALLIPVIGIQLSHSMKDTKKRIADKMNELLMEIFDPRQPPFIHSRSAPNEVGIPSSSRSSRVQRIYNTDDISMVRSFPRYFN